MVNVFVLGGEKHTGGGRESGSDSWKQYMRRSTWLVFSFLLFLFQILKAKTFHGIKKSDKFVKHTSSAPIIGKRCSNLHVKLVPDLSARIFF